MSNEDVGLEQHDDGGTRAPSIKLVLALLVVVAVAVFFFQNGNSASVTFLWMDVTWPIRSIIVISVIAGIAIDRLVLWQWRRARKRKAEPPAS